MNTTLKYAAGAAVLAGLALIVFGMVSGTSAPPPGPSALPADTTGDGGGKVAANAAYGAYGAAEIARDLAAKVRTATSGEARNAAGGTGSNGAVNPR